MRSLICAAMLAALPVTALADAEGFAADDLGNVPDDPACISKAERVFEAKKTEVSAGNIVTGPWTIGLYDIINDEYVALIVCQYGPNGQIRGTVVVYSDDGTEARTRSEISQRITAIWRSMP